jgi:glycerophosphoryl diester phosphodiesterase
VPTLQEVIDLARSASGSTHRTIGIVPEIKHSTYFRSVGLDQESALLKVLRRNRLDDRRAPVIVQSFEISNLQLLHRTSKVHTVQLLDASGGPADVRAAGGTTTYAQMVTPAGLRRIATYADAVAPNTNWVLPRDASGASRAPTSFVRDAHRVGLPVVVWTFRRENSFLPTERRNGADPATPGDLQGYITRFLELGVDAVFSDNPDVAVAATKAFEARSTGGHGHGRAALAG